jgi:hypothetical protein
MVLLALHFHMLGVFAAECAMLEEIQLLFDLLLVVYSFFASAALHSYKIIL